MLGRDGDFRSLAFFPHRAYSEMLHEGGFASLVEDASGGADLRVAVARDVAHQEVDQAAFFLKNGEKIDHLGVGLRLLWRRPHGGDRFGGGSGGLQFRTIRENGEEKHKCAHGDRLRQDGVGRICIRRQGSVRRQRQNREAKRTMARVMLSFRIVFELFLSRSFVEETNLIQASRDRNPSPRCLPKVLIDPAASGHGACDLGVEVSVYSVCRQDMTAQLPTEMRPEGAAPIPNVGIRSNRIFFNLRARMAVKTSSDSR